MNYILGSLSSKTVFEVVKDYIITSYYNKHLSVLQLGQVTSSPISWSDMVINWTHLEQNKKSKKWLFLSLASLSSWVIFILSFTYSLVYQLFLFVYFYKKSIFLQSFSVITTFLWIEKVIIDLDLLQSLFYLHLFLYPYFMVIF